MELIYVIINFLILAVIIFVFARKTIISIFRKRRENINSELDDAEKEENFSEDGIEEEIPTLPTLDRKEIDDAKKAVDDKIRQIKEFEEREKHEIKRMNAEKMKADAIKILGKKLAEIFSSEPYLSRIRMREENIVDKILEQVTLTSGDMAYLKSHDVLYVTLTSAFPLDSKIVGKVDTYTTEMLKKVNGKTSLWVKEDSSVIGGLRLRIGDTVYDGSVSEELYQLQNSLQKKAITGDESAEDIVKLIEERANNFVPKIYQYQLGRVISVSDGICWLDGLADIMYGEVIEFECGERGMVLDIQSDKIGCVIYGSYEHIDSGSKVRRVGRIASVPVGNGLLGRVVNSVGKPTDGKGYIPHDENRPIEYSAPKIPDRSPVCKPLHTGIKAIDALVPVGRGQRELIIGDRQTGKSAIIVDSIINQKGKDVVCIYVAIGQKETTIAEIKEKLEKYGAMEYTTIVSASASESAALQYIAPFSGTAMGEYFMYSGKDVLIIYDDLSKHAVAYRELSLLLHRPSGREAYPGDIFYLHSRLLERSAHLSDELGGGSMTAFPIIETLAGDISSYIPTNVISITDGQIFLESELFHEGQRPAVNVGLSVSRVGSVAQTKLMKQVSASLRTNLAQYRDLADFTQFGAEIDEETKKMLNSGDRLMAVLKQGRYAPLDDWKQALVIYSVNEGFASHISVKDMETYENGLYPYFENNFAEIVAELKTGKKMSDEFINTVKHAVSQYVKEFENGINQSA